MDKDLRSTDQHISLQLADDVLQLTKPLFEFIPINYFRFFRIWKKDKSYIRLSTNSYWTEHYIKNQYAIVANPNSVFKSGESSFYLLDLAPKSEAIFKVLQEARDHSQLDHGFSIQEEYEDYIDIYDLTADPSQVTINEVYLRYLDSLKKFMVYFKMQGHSLIKIAEKNKFLDNAQKNIGSRLNFDKRKNKFDQALVIDRLSIPNGEDDILLTKRETQCLVGILFGKTSKILGKDLGISSRTVECYIDSVKTKLNCTYKDEVIKKVMTCVNLELIKKYDFSS